MTDSVFAMGVTTFGGPEALHPLALPREELGSRDVRIAVAAAAVNPADTMRRVGWRSSVPDAPPPGMVPGMDVAGEIVEVGSAVVTGLTRGDQVMAIVFPAGPHGGYRADLVVPEANVIRIPSNLSAVEAATLPMNALTALRALDLCGISAEHTIAVSGAAGAVGGFAVQIAKARGAFVVADAAEADEALVRSLGADLVVPRGPRFSEAIRDVYPDGVDALVDVAILGADALSAVRDGGVFAAVRAFLEEPARNIRIETVSVGDYADRHDKLELIRDYAERGSITARVARTLPAPEAPEAHRRLEAGGVRGRIVLMFR